MTEPKTLTLSQLVERLAAAERALREIGNIVGGPTMTYAPAIEIQEWRKRADRISELVATTVAYSSNLDRKVVLPLDVNGGVPDAVATDPTNQAGYHGTSDLNFSDRGKEGE